MTILFFGGIICLQIHLSKKAGKWSGLVLPILNFSFATLVALMMSPTHSEVTTAVNGTIVEAIRTPIEGAGVHMLYTFLFVNIGTMVLLLIYKNYRRKLNVNRAMN